MTKKDYTAIAQMFAQSYDKITDSKVKNGYNLAIRDFMRYAAGQNPKFDPIKFAVATYGITTKIAEK